MVYGLRHKETLPRRDRRLTPTELSERQLLTDFFKIRQYLYIKIQDILRVMSSHEVIASSHTCPQFNRVFISSIKLVTRPESILFTFGLPV